MAALAAARLLHYAALAAMFGVSLFPLYALRGLAAEALRRRLRSAAVIGGGVALASGLAWYALTAASMAGALPAALDPGVLLTVLSATAFGPIWLARMLLILAAALGLAAAAPDRDAWRGAVPLLSGLALAGVALTGHALLPGGGAGLVHQAADAAHLLAAGAWLGGLVALAAALATQAPDGLGVMLSRFSGMGYAAVAALVLSGVVNAWLLVGAPGRLVSTPYGRLLSAKIVLFLGMAALAAANRFHIAPQLAEPAADPRWLHRIRRNVWLEQALGLAVLALVAVIGLLQPAVES